MIILHRRGTTEEWQQADLIAKQLTDVLLKDGEFAIEECSDGSRRVKIGDGHTKFNALPYIDVRAEIYAKKLAQTTEATLQKRINNLDRDHRILVKNTTTELLNKISTDVANLVTAYKSADSQIVEETAQSISNAIKALKGDFSKEIESIEVDINNISAKVANIENSVGNQTTITSNQLQTVKNSIEALSETLKKDSAELATRLTTHEERSAEAIQAMASELTNNFNFDLSSAKSAFEKSIEASAATQAANTRSVKLLLENTLAVDRSTNEQALADLRAEVTNTKADLASTIAQVDKRDANAIADILTKLVELKTHSQQLVSTDKSLSYKIHAVDNVLTSAINKLSSQLEVLATNHTSDVTDLAARINSIEESQHASDMAIIDKMRKYISDIYAELADLVDDDILILEKAFSVENTLTSRLSALETALADTNSIVYELTPEYFNELKAIVDKAIPAHFNEITKLKEAIGSAGTRFVGITTSNILDGSATNHIIISGTKYVASVGDIVIYGENEFIWTGNTWKAIGAVSRTGKLEQWRAELNFNDEQSPAQFVTAVKQSDGKLTLSKARPTTSDIKHNENTLSEELVTRTKQFTELASRSVQFNNTNNRLYVGNNLDDSIIFNCGTAGDI